jgi:hypothetical protein
MTRKPMAQAIGEHVQRTAAKKSAPAFMRREATEEKANVASKAQLKELGALAMQLVATDEEIEQIEAQLKGLKDIGRKLREESIPELMREVGMKSFKMEDGTSIDTKEEVFASIPEAHREAAFKWLEEHDLGSVVRTEVKAQFGMGELEKAEALTMELLQQELNVTLARNVHPQTLKALIKEQLAAGKDVPLDLFGARPVSVAKVTLPKPAKKRTR